MMTGTHGAHASDGIPPPPPGPHLEAAGDRACGQALFAWYAPGFSDALGDRLLLFDNTNGHPLQLLRLRPELTTAPDFEASLRERTLELAAFDDPRFARIYRVDWLPDPGGGLAIVSEHVEGTRLSEVLARARERQGCLGADLALTVVGDLLSGLSALHRQGPGIAHAALGPERLVVAPSGRLLITEYVLGLALRRLVTARPSLARDLRIPLGPGDAGACDQRQDVFQAGMTALALLLPGMPAGRGVEELLTESGERARLNGWDEVRWNVFRAWLGRALHIDAARPFDNAVEAKAALEDSLARRPGTGSRDAAIAGFLADLDRSGGPLLLQATVGDERSVEPTPANAASRDGGAAVGPAESPAAAATELLAFPTEQALSREVAGGSPPVAMRTAAAPRRTTGLVARALGSRRAWVVAVLAALVVVEGAYIGSRLLVRAAPVPSVGTLRLESNPAHASVSIDGRPAGLTPTAIRLAPGRHQVDLSSGGRRRRIVVALEAGASSSQFVDLPPGALGVGDIDVRSEPAGARVTVDGEVRGTTPLVVKGIAIGAHDVRLDRRGRVVTQSVRVEEAATASLFVPFAGGDAPAPGWLAIDSPLELQVYADDELVGTSESERIMLPAGRHEIVLVNDLVGFRTSREVTVPVGRTASVDVAVPGGTLDINASPWAEVSIDGQKVGETPLAGIPAPLGRHRVTFKHPTLGERTVECVVTLKQAARVSVDLRK